MKLAFNKTCLGSKLLGELLSARISLETGISPVQTSEGVTYVYVPDTTPQEVINQINTIVETHDPTPPLIYDPVDEEKAALAEAVIDLETRLSNLEAKLNA